MESLIHVLAAAAVVGGGLVSAAAQSGGGGEPKPKLERAVIKKKPAPECTWGARANRAEGRVVLRAVLAKTGEVTNIQLKQSQPFGLSASAIAAARQIKFEPAKKDGRPVSQWVTLEYNFYCAG